MGATDDLAEHLRLSGVLGDPSVDAAFRAVDRADFVLPDLRAEAGLDVALPIGSGQTISQPYTVAFMLELLEPAPGQTILDVGSGSGWQAALLAHVVSAGGAKGRVVGIEIVPELAELAERNLRRYNFVGRGIAEVRCQDATDGAPDAAPFDRIIAAASQTADVPPAWIEQLKSGGIIVTPIGDAVVRIEKQPDGTLEREEHAGFAFVPFVTD